MERKLNLKSSPSSENSVMVTKKSTPRVTPKQIGKIISTKVERKKLPTSIIYRDIAKQLKYLPGKSLRKIAFTKQLQVNGTRKQRDELEEKDFKVYIEEFVMLSFSRKNEMHKWYLSFLCAELKKIGIQTVKDLLKNIMQINEFESTSHLKLTEKEIQVITHLAAEWLHYQLPPKGELEDDIEPALMTVVTDTAMFTKGVEMTKTTWLGDSGASSHMCNDDTNFIECHKINTKIRIGDGHLLRATKIGTMKLEVVQKNGTTQSIILKEVQYVPDLAINMFCITKALDNGWTISNKEIFVSLSKKKVKITFDKVFRTEYGVVLGIELRPFALTVQAYTSIEKGLTIDINKFH